MNKKQNLSEIGKAIKDIEARVSELEKSLKNESSIRHKINMQQTLKTNKDLLVKMKELLFSIQAQ